MHPPQYARSRRVMHTPVQQYRSCRKGGFCDSDVYTGPRVSPDVQNEHAKHYHNRANASRHKSHLGSYTDPSSAMLKPLERSLERPPRAPLSEHTLRHTTRKHFEAIRRSTAQRLLGLELLECSDGHGSRIPLGLHPRGARNFCLLEHRTRHAAVTRHGKHTDARSQRRRTCPTFQPSPRKRAREHALQV